MVLAEAEWLVFKTFIQKVLASNPGYCGVKKEHLITMASVKVPKSCYVPCNSATLSDCVMFIQCD